MHPSLLQAASSELAPDRQDNDSEETIRRILVDFNYLHCSKSKFCLQLLLVSRGKDPHCSNTGRISKDKDSKS